MDRNRELVEAFFAASGRHDLDAVEGMLHEDFVMAWPQSGETFSGRTNAVGTEARPSGRAPARHPSAEAQCRQDLRRQRPERRDP